jgi:hypothetical protein
VLVGNSFGEPIASNLATTCSNDVTGLVFVDGVSEEQRVDTWNKAVLICVAFKDRFPGWEETTICVRRRESDDLRSKTRNVDELNVGCRI